MKREGSFAITSPTGTRDPWQAGLVPYSGGSDHEVFMGGGLQVPATMFGSWPDYFYHTNQDTPDKCDPTALRRAVVLGMMTAGSIANMDSASAVDFADRMYARARPADGPGPRKGPRDPRTGPARKRRPERRR